MIGFAGVIFLFGVLLYCICMEAEMPREQYERVYADMQRYPQMQKLYDEMMDDDGQMSNFEFNHWHRRSIVEYRKWYIKSYFRTDK